MLDAILSDGGDGTYGFDRRWGPDAELASMDNGSGDEYSIVFTAAGAFVRGFDHESVMSPYGDENHRTWPGLIEAVPLEFAEWVSEPAFCDDGGAGPFLAATVCLWRRHDQPAWQTGDIEFPTGRRAGGDPDGASWLFHLLADGTPDAYCRYAADYFGHPVDPADVRHVFEHRPLDPELVRRLNPDASLAGLAEPLDTIGFPSP
ncbi:hypothetical protein [Spirillospora sp. NPDC029432]|uniref:hypothetical protein n=1 Tax=Spirillospora sp. NPDC029432 TaxID=3154599 RepID=UPI0034567AA3